MVTGFTLGLCDTILKLAVPGSFFSLHYLHRVQAPGSRWKIVQGRSRSGAQASFHLAARSLWLMHGSGGQSALKPAAGIFTATRFHHIPAWLGGFTRYRLQRRGMNSSSTSTSQAGAGNQSSESY